MNILVIPTTDWVRHPVPNRLNFIFDHLARDHEVYVLHFRLGKFKENSPRSTDCTLIPAGFENIDDPSFYYLLSSPLHLYAIRKIVKEKKIDVILSANILPSFFANYTGKPVVFDYLDHLEESASIYYPGSLRGAIIQWFTRMITRFNLKHASSIITVSSDFEDYLHGFGLEDITVIPNGVDTGILAPVARDDAKQSLNLKGKNVIGYIGSLEYWVDLETAIQALPNLDATLLIVGPGLFTDYGEKLKQMANACGVSDRVIFVGAVEFRELSRYISAMDIGLNPLKPIEKNQLTIGGKVFNYLSCGIPVLSSRMTALERLFGDDLFYYDDVPSFIERVNEILSKENQEDYYRSLTMRFDWKNLAKVYESVLMDAI